MIGTIQQHIAAMEPDIPLDKVSCSPVERSSTHLRRRCVSSAHKLKPYAGLRVAGPVFYQSSPS